MSLIVKKSEKTKKELYEERLQQENNKVVANPIRSNYIKNIIERAEQQRGYRDSDRQALIKKTLIEGKHYNTTPATGGSGENEISSETPETYEIPDEDNGEYNVDELRFNGGFSIEELGCVSDYFTS